MKLEPIRTTVLTAIIACIFGIAFFFIYTNNISEVANKQVNVNSETGFSEDKNAVHELLIIYDKGKYGFASIKGEVLEEAKYDIISLADYGLYYVKEGQMQGFVNAYMQPVFMTEETINTNLSEDYVIYTRDKKSGFINVKTGEKINTDYDAVYDFSEGFSAVQLNDKIGFINTSGELVIKPKYYTKGLYYFKSGLCNVRLRNSDSDNFKSYYIDKNDKIVIDSNFEYGMPFYENMAFVMENGHWYVIDIRGKTIGKNKYGPYEKSVPGRFKDGFATVIENGKYGVINSDGSYVINPEYEELADISNKKIIFKQNGKYGYMTIAGDIIIKPKYDNLSNFKNSLAVFTIDNKYGLINEKGKEIIQAENEKIEVLDNGIVKVFSEGKEYSYINEKGELIWKSNDKK